MASDIRTLPVIGELPKEWSVIRFRDVLVGGTRNGIYKQKEFHGRGAKIVNMGELFANPRLFDVPMRRVVITPEEIEKSSIQSGDLLFARRSLVAEGAGKCCIVRHVSEATTFESSIIRARPNPTIADSLYLFYLFNSPFGFHALDTIRRQVAVSGITGSDLVELELPIPPLAEQRAIANILGTLDDKIELNRRMNETLEGLARAIFQSWFVDFDPVRAKRDGMAPPGLTPEIAALFPDSFEDSELGKIPKGWKWSALRTIADIVSGGTPHKGTEEFWNGTIPWVSPKAMNHIHIRDSDEHVTESAVGNGTRRVPKGTVLVMVRGMGLHQGVRISQAQRDVTFNQDVKAVIAKSVSPAFLLYGLLDAAPMLLSKVHASGHGTGVLSTEFLDRLTFATPPDDVLAQLTELLAANNTRIASNDLETVQLAAIRDALLPKLLSGEIRVAEAERLVEDAT